MKRNSEEKEYRGVSVCSGIAIGLAHFLIERNWMPDTGRPIDSGEVDAEIGRYKAAVTSSKGDLKQLQKNLEEDGSKDASNIIDGHIQMLDDPVLTTNVVDRIKETLKSTETVFHSVMSEYEKQFASIDDAYLKERLIDVKDVKSRVLENLRPKRQKRIFPRGSILFAKELTPSDVLDAISCGVLALLSLKGGHTCHAALIAKAKGIPYLTCVSMPNVSNETLKGDIILDSINGKLIVNPTKKTKLSYLKKQKEHKLLEKILEKDASKNAQTKDGQSIDMQANMGKNPNFSALQKMGICRVGLLRTELLYLDQDLQILSYEKQLSDYREIKAQSNDMSIVYRLFDTGGDKAETGEANPALGKRGIRYLLKNPVVLERQLKALLCSYSGSCVSIMIPMVSDISEIKLVKSCIQKIYSNEKRESLANEIRIGAMIEVPSAALMINEILKEVDFVSIGCNDLTQYVLATDRTELDPNDQFKWMHPSVLRLIQSITEAANKTNQGVTVCGDLASNPVSMIILIGLGLRSFSSIPRNIPLIKKVIAKYSLKQCEKLAKEALDTFHAAKAIESIEKKIKKVLESEWK